MGAVGSFEVEGTTSNGRLPLAFGVEEEDEEVEAAAAAAARSAWRARNFSLAFKRLISIRLSCSGVSCNLPTVSALRKLGGGVDGRAVGDMMVII